MALIQLLFWFGILVLSLGLGIGALYWFSVRRDQAREAPAWRTQAPDHQRTGA